MDWLKGNRICLRALEPTDLEHLYKWENNSELWHVSDTLAPFSKYILKEYIENAPKNIYENRQLRLVIEFFDNEINHVVGAIDLFDYDPYHCRAAVGIFIDPDFQNNGLGIDALETIKNYAFNYLHLNMLFCHVGADNKKSKTFFIKGGFSVCGEINAWLKGANGYINSYLMQCLNPKNKI